MKSAGNDIVALAKIDKHRTCQYRFYSKILSCSEEALYHQAQFTEFLFEKFVWLLWSVKESAYKFLKRNSKDLIFSPLRIVVQHIEIPSVFLTVKSNENYWTVTNDEKTVYKGKLTYNGHTLYFRSKVSEAWIASVVNGDDNFENVHWGIRSINDDRYDNQSAKAREFLLNELNLLFTGSLITEKNPVGYIEIIRNNMPIDIPVSISHDGMYVSYTFDLTCFHKMNNVRSA